MWEGDADMVLAPGSAGLMGILPNHSPLLSTLNLGVLTVRTKGEERHFTIAGGVIEVQPKLITVMADAAENVGEIDVARAEAAKKRAEELLRSGVPSDVDAYLALESALKRSTLRLDAVKRFRGQRNMYGGGSTGEEK